MDQFYERCKSFITQLWELRDELMVSSFYTNEIDTTLLLVQELLAENQWWDLFRQLEPKTTQEKTITSLVVVLLNDIETICKDRMRVHTCTEEYIKQFQETGSDSLYDVLKGYSRKGLGVDDCIFEIHKKRPNTIPHGDPIPLFDNKTTTVNVNDSASSFDDEDQEPRKLKNGRRINFPSKVRDYLKEWLFAHKSDPFPTDVEKTELCKETGLTKDQLNNWFINGRRRYLSV